MATPARRVTGEAPARGPCSRLAVLGLVVAATAPLWLLVSEGLAALAFVGPFVALPLLVAVAVWRVGRWTRVLGGLAGLALLVTAAPAIPEVVGHPDSFFDFFPLVSAAVGGLLAVGASIAPAGRAPGGNRRLHATPGEAKVAVGTLAALVVLGAVSGALTLSGRSTVDAAQRLGAVPVAMDDFEFVPADLTAAAGRPTRFVLRNDDLALHTFTVPELGLDVIVKPGREELVELPASRAGVYELICRPHTQDGEGMVGVLTVE